MNDNALPLATEGNPAVDREVLRKANEITERLQKLGISTSKGYAIEPALGGRHTPVSPRVSAPTQAQPTSAVKLEPRRTQSD
jgi:hypothetical protein